MPKTFINGIDLHYNVYGSGAPVLLVHGLGMDQSVWDLQVPELSRDYQVIVYDLRGHGQSESPDHPYSINLFADDLDYFLHFLGLRKSILLGLSLGGRILLQFAHKYPQETRGLVLAGAHEASEESKQHFRRLAEVARREGMGAVAEEFFSWPVLRGLAELNRERFQRMKEKLARSSAVGFAHSCLAIAKMECITDLLGEIKAPTLALTGERDEPYLPYLDLYSRKIPNCQKRVIPGAGHMGNLENPEAFNQAVLSFLKTLQNP